MKSLTDVPEVLNPSKNKIKNIHDSLAVESSREKILASIIRNGMVDDVLIVLHFIHEKADESQKPALSAMLDALIEVRNDEKG